MSSNWLFNVVDGNVIKVGRERFQCGEVLFNPSLITNNITDRGIHQLAIDSIKSSDCNIHHIISQNIILSGGNTMIDQNRSQLNSGIVARLTNEVNKLLPSLTLPPQSRAKATLTPSPMPSSRTPKSSLHLSVIAPTERKYSVWIGGSILSSLSTFKHLGITKEVFFCIRSLCARSFIVIATHRNMTSLGHSL
jgi:actin